MVVRLPAKKVPAKKSASARGPQHNVGDTWAGVLGLHGERMGKVDTAWLRMDSPSNLMMIVGVWVVQPGISYEDLYQRLQERLLKYPRFGQCVVDQRRPL